MDKNKSAFKICNLPKIYWLNLDSDTHRREYMEKQFQYWGIENHHHISGYDGRDDDVASYLKGRIPDNMTQNEVGCVLSHLKAIKHFYEETNEPYVLILEDDVSFDPVKYWNFNWTDFVSNLPYDWDCVQLTTICTGNIHINLHNRFINDFSAAAYLISRHHAEKIVKHHIRGDKYKIDNGVKPRAVCSTSLLRIAQKCQVLLDLIDRLLKRSTHPRRCSQHAVSLTSVFIDEKHWNAQR